MATKKVKDRKYQLADELKQHFQDYTKLFLVDCDNVGSNQIQQIRIALRGKAILYCGKNTQMRRVLRELENDGMAQLEKVRMQLKLNVALVFTNEDLPEVRDLILENKVAAPARAGSIAQSDVVVPAGNTGMEPTMTSFLQALNIPSKITKGSIEILNPVHLITEGDKCEASQCALLDKLGIKPFSYGLVVKSVYDDGSMYDPAVLDITDDDILASFAQGIKNVAAISVSTGLPTVASVPYSILLGFANLLAIAVETDYTFKEAEQIKEFIANPEAFASAAPAAAASSADAAAPAAEAKKESSSDDAGGAGGMFEDDY
jgi:large subunit ribosomal protein LP0